MLVILIFPTSYFPSRITNLFFVRYKYFISFLWAILVFLTCGLIKNKILLPVWLFLCAGGLATIVNANAYSVYIQLFITTFSSVVITFFYIKLRGFHGIENISILFVLIIIINTITEIFGGTLKPATNNLGITTYKFYYFIGTRVHINNIFIFSFILSLIIALDNSLKYKVLAFTGILAGLYFIISLAVSTAIATVIIFVTVLIATRIIRSAKVWRNISTFVLVLAILFYFVSVNSELYAWFINGFLDESLTFSGRTYLWEQAINGMNGWHWLLGNGMRSTYFTLGSTFSVNTAHSQYLNILYYFGFLGLAAYIYLMYNQFKVIGKITDQRIRSILIAGNIAIVIMGIPTTTFIEDYMYIFFVIVSILPGVFSNRGIETLKL